jgi:hypothetical protein
MPGFAFNFPAINGRDGEATAHVLGECYRLKMVGIHATTHAAEVIELLFSSQGPS